VSLVLHRRRRVLTISSARWQWFTGTRGTMVTYVTGQTLAEGEGFEPSSPCGLPVFKTGAINHSATPPWAPSSAQQDITELPTTPT
jgi:hypothetical protein